PRPGKQKGSRSCLFRRRGSGSLLEADAGELVAELLDPAAEVVDALLSPGVERVRFAGGLQLDQRQFAAIVHGDRFARLQARTRDELEAVGQVLEADLAVLGVDALFHRVLTGYGSHMPPAGACTFRFGEGAIIAAACPQPPRLIISKKSKLFLLDFILSRMNSIASISSIGYSSLRRIQVFCRISGLSRSSSRRVPLLLS